MAAPVPGTQAWYKSRATPLPPKSLAPPGGFGSVVKAIKTGVGKPGAQLVKKPGTPQGSLTQIESMDQIEARVRKLADENFNRQQGTLKSEADRLRQEAEGRRVALTNAYATVAQMNANLGQNVQGGWNEAARTIQGLANTGTGATAEGLQNELATQEQALSRVGAGGTGFDARSQAGVEAYRGGTLPGEFFARQGAAGNQWMNQNAVAMNQRGWQEGVLAENEARAKVGSDYDEQIAKLQTGRTDYETDLRKQLLGARQDQIDTLEKAAAKVADIRKAQSDLRYKYWNAKNTATTKAQLQQIEMINKQTDRDLKLQMNEALNAQRYASANLSDVRAQDILSQPPGGAPKPPSGASLSAAVPRADKLGKAALQTALDNVWKQTPGNAPTAAFAAKHKDLTGKALTAAYLASPEYAAALAINKRQLTASFGTIQRRVYGAIYKVYKPLGYTDEQIRKEAFKITSARITAPAGWVPGVGPAQPGAAVSNPFGPGINLNPGAAPTLRA